MEVLAAKRSRGAARRATAEMKDAKLRELAEALTAACILVGALQKRLDAAGLDTVLDSRLAIRIAAHVPDLAAKLGKENESHIEKLRRNVAAHSQDIGSGAQLLVASAPALRKLEKGPRLGGDGGAGTGDGGVGGGGWQKGDEKVPEGEVHAQGEPGDAIELAAEEAAKTEAEEKMMKDAAERKKVEEEAKRLAEVIAEAKKEAKIAE